MAMTTWSYSLVWLSFLFLGQIAKQTNGDVSPPWITNQGCYDWNTGFRRKPLSDNGPTSCFNECANFTHIGIQAKICVCLEHMPSNPHIPYFRCQIQSQSGQHMLVYSKVIVLPTTISQADYGHVYVSILPTWYFEFHASNSSSEVHGICYEDGQMKCKCVTAADNGEIARRIDLISYNDFENACQKVPGSYWIGMFRETPVTYTNGEVTPPWITLLGCFYAEIGSQSIPMSGNSPTNCFKECKNFSYVGMQNNSCICSKAFQNITDVKNAALIPYTRCNRGENRFMSLYAKVFSLPNTINQDADYGHVHVNISSSSSYEFHASKESTEKYGFICYDYTKQCRYGTSTIDRMNSALAWNECNLVSYFDFDSCLNTFVIEYGVFWIGMYRDSLDFSSTSSTLLTKISTLPSSSTPTTTSQLTTDTPSPLTTDTPSTKSLNMETITPTASPFPTENRASIDVDACIDGDKVCNNNGHCTNTHEIFSCRCYEGYTGKNCETGIWPGPLFAGVAVAVTVPVTVIITLLIIWRRGALRLACSLLGQGPKEKEITCSEPHLRMDPASNNTITSRAADERIYDQPNNNMIEMNAYLEPTVTGIHTGNRDRRNHSREYEKLRLNENPGNSLYSSYNEHQS